jgi:bifunctional UDP-N-acetylglucosamine pyrophosphorylase/glucosamine-1-phosphate N-acetyltransferase
MTLKNSLTVIILAAGQGSRMRSVLPKVLHNIACEPMLAHVMRTAQRLGSSDISVVASPLNVDVLSPYIKPHNVVIQDEALGTGHAVRSASDVIAKATGTVLVLYGDGPLYTPETLLNFIKSFEADKNAGVGFLGMKPSDPTGYGRMKSDQDGYITHIVEQKDATEQEKSIGLCWTGVMCAKADRLNDWLAAINNDNAQGEYYLTDLPKIALQDDIKTMNTLCPIDETLGANNRIELANLENKMQEKLRARAMENGATLLDPNTVYLCEDTVIGQDVTIEPNVFFGKNVVIGDNCHVKAFSHIEGATLKDGVVVGPFARLRPGTVLEDNVKIGNFVEVKNATFGVGAKAGHLTYVGDASVGKGSNIGAGTVTCNYDGVNKHKTSIGEGVFVGSHSTLIAPITVDNGAYIGAGSTLSKDVPEEALAVARARVIIKDGWAKGKTKK